MRPTDLDRYRQNHDHAPDRSAAEKSTRRVIALTAVMMVVEILAGWRFHSMALLADGWHMGTHVAAFLITAVAYAMGRRHRGNPSFSFGTGKFDVLGGYTSALILGVVAALMAAESVLRFFTPLHIDFNVSIAVGLVGLCVNVASALMLKHDHGHGHAHGHGHHGHGKDHEDLNLKAAYIHVLADAATSVMAVSALAAGKYLGWVWMDPVMGIVGSGVVAQWSWGLLRDTSVILLDRTPQTDLEDEIRKAVETDGDAAIADLHIWQVGVGQFYAMVSIVARQPRTPEHYRKLFSEHEELLHVTVEVHRYDEPVAAEPPA
ncbi:MAG TPA: CDF family Co(II)/Ni(II) efflux transporter DmeF [Opitutaceae bacterium]|nr:CDF family Co(II)/Ni(II) efflux transporter DmeF [Opitutaceae bacterium]